MEPIHFVGLSGSLRNGSYNTKLLHVANTLLPENVTMEIADIAGIPLYNGDLDLPLATERPPVITAFRQLLQKADAFVICSPEYNYSIPGPLKNAIDWASRGQDAPLLNKAVALMGATQGMWGTVRMQAAFHPVFQFLNMRSVYKPEILVAQAQNKFDEDGSLKDEPTRALMEKQLQALKKLVVQMKGEK